MHILIVGASGFVGRHLAKHLAAKGHQVEAWTRRPAPPTSGVRWRTVDLDAPPPPEDRPWDAAFHLAANSRPGIPWDDRLVLENVGLCGKVFDHLARVSPGCRTVLASSGHVYAPGTSPLRETDPLAPQGLYGLSKQLSEAWAQFHVRHLDVQIVRAFNQIGPGMPSGLLLTDLITRIRNEEGPLRMRGRDDVKDFLDIRDAMLAYETLLQVSAPSGSVWNLCSGRSTKVSEFIQAVQECLGTSREVTFASEEVQHMVGDAAKLMGTGWAPAIGLSGMVAHAMEEGTR